MTSTSTKGVNGPRHTTPSRQFPYYTVDFETPAGKKINSLCVEFEPSTNVDHFNLPLHPQGSLYLKVLFTTDLLHSGYAFVKTSDGRLWQAKGESSGFVKKDKFHLVWHKEPISEAEVSMVSELSEYGNVEPSLRVDRSPRSMLFTFENEYKPALESILQLTLAAFEKKYERNISGSNRMSYEMKAVEGEFRLKESLSLVWQQCVLGWSTCRNTENEGKAHS